MVRSRRRYRWQWGRDWEAEAKDGKEAWGTYSHYKKKPLGLTLLNPELRPVANHDLMWETLGHEFIHLLTGSQTATKKSERLARLLEERAGHALHDLVQFVRKGGLTKCRNGCLGKKAGKSRKTR